MIHNRPNIAVFISGHGSNLQSLIDASNNETLSGEIALVVSNTKKAYGLTRAEEAGIPTFIYRVQRYDSPHEAVQGLLDKLKEYNIEYIALAGYLKLLSPDLIAAFNNRIINIHPALLPKYGGKGMYGIHVHEAVLKAGEIESGVTFHVVNEKYDEGRILKQIKVPVLKDDSPETLQQRIQTEEHKYYPLVLDNFIKGEYDNN